MSWCIFLGISPQGSKICKIYLASKQVNIGKIPYTSFLQNCMVFVNVGFPAFAKGDVKASLSFGCQLLLLTVFAILVVIFTSNVGIVVGSFYRSLDNAFGFEFAKITLVISLCRMLTRLAQRTFVHGCEFTQQVHFPKHKLPGLK